MKMENILRFLSLKKEYRMAVVDMSQLSHKLLQDFNGSEEVKKVYGTSGDGLHPTSRNR